MIEVRLMTKSGGSNRFPDVRSAQVILPSGPDVRVWCDFDGDDGRITVTDEEVSVEFYLPVRLGVALLRSIATDYAERLKDIVSERASMGDFARDMRDLRADHPSGTMVVRRLEGADEFDTAPGQMRHAPRGLSTDGDGFSPG